MKKNRIIEDFNYLIKKDNRFVAFCKDLFGIRKRKYNELMKLLTQESLEKYDLATLKKIEFFLLGSYYKNLYDDSVKLGKNIDSIRGSAEKLNNIKID